MTEADDKLCGHCRPPVELHGACLEPDCSCPCNQDDGGAPSRRTEGSDKDGTR